VALDSKLTFPAPSARRLNHAVLSSGTRKSSSLTSADWADILARVKGGETRRKVAAYYNISHQTINRRVRGGNIDVTRFGPEPRMTAAGEAELVNWVNLNAERALAVPVAAFKEKVARVAGDIGDPSFKGGRKFLSLFMRRHKDIARRSPELTDRKRLYALHPDKVAAFYKQHEVRLKGIPPWKLWNYDEQGFDRKHVQKTGKTKVLAPRGSKQVQSASDGNRDHVSIGLFFNAAGDYLPPTILIAGKNITPAKREFMSGYPEAMYILCENATQTEDTWAECVRYFNEKVNERWPGGGHLLFVDGHSSRVSLDAVNTLAQSGNDLATLPPNATHAFQPHDVGVAGPLKAAIEREVALVRLGDSETPGESIGNKNIMKALKKAITRTMLPRVDEKTGNTTSLAANAFAATGIHPFNPKAVDERLTKPAQWMHDSVASKLPPPPVVPLDKRAELVAQHTKEMLESGDVKERLARHVKATRKHAVPGNTLLTGLEHIAQSLATEQVKAAEVVASEERRDARKAASAAAKAAKAAKVAKAGNGDGAAAPAVAAAPAKVPKAKGVKRKRERAQDVGVDEVEALRRGAGARRAERNAAREGEDE
jgi:hypothetical protein